MRKIINGKAYDTSTATKLAVHDNGLLPNDFDYTEETLFRKKTGEFFLYGEGGARTKYGKESGPSSRIGGAEIIPMTMDEAKKWVENHANERYEEIFGDAEE